MMILSMMVFIIFGDDIVWKIRSLFVKVVACRWINLNFVVPKPMAKEANITVCVAIRTAHLLNLTQPWRQY